MNLIYKNIKKRLLSIALFAASLAAMAQVGVGTTTPQAALDVVSSNSGFLFPRVANAAAVSNPKNGMIVYDLSLHCFNFYENDAWTGCLDPNVASNGILAQIGSEADDPDATNSVVTLAQLERITPAIRILNAANETAYQNYIDANPALFSNPATQAEVQAMVDAVNSAAVLAQIGREADDPDAINSMISIAQFECIAPAINALDAANETIYQAYIDANPALFSNPATQAEVQAMIDAVNSSATVLAQIGGEADDPDATNSVVTLAQLASIVPALTGVFADKEVSYQNYIDGNPALFSNPATQAEVQAMLNAISATDVVGPNGKIWMDRNLGASQVATSSTNSAAYGDMYQWGRGADGHEARNSSSTTTTSTGDAPNHGNFIRGSIDWRTTANDNLWQGANGTNNPCPAGYRIPTEAEWDGLGITNAATAFSSPLKLTLVGNRRYSDSTINNLNSRGYYWTSTVDSSISDRSRDFNINSSSSDTNSHARANAFAVRCIKD